MAKPSAEDFLAHHGIRGMHWGQRKSAAAPKVRPPRQPKKKYSEMTDKEKQHHDDVQGLVVAGAFAGGYVAARAGLHFLGKHPEIIARGYNTINGTKSIGTGYKVVKLVMQKSGSYAL